MNVVILHDEASESSSPDQADVLLQTAAVAEALRELGFEPVTVSISLDVQQVIDTLRHINPVFVFNLVECMHSRGHLIHIIPSVLDYLGLPYTGSSSEALFITSYKPAAKTIMQGASIPTAAWWGSTFAGDTYPFPAGSPIILKSVWEHASAGLDDDAVVTLASSEGLAPMLASRAERLGTACYAESFIPGREFNVSLLASSDGVETLPPAEILFEDFPPERQEIVGYRAKWEEDSFEYGHTPRTFEFSSADQTLLVELARIAERCWNLFGLHGYARVDFRVDNLKQPWVLEINANPCLSPDGGFLAAAAERNLTPVEVIHRIIDDCMRPVTSGRCFSNRN